MSENTTERRKSALKTIPSPQGVTLKYSDLLSHFISCACWEYSRKSYLTLNSSQPNRKRHLKILSLTRRVMTAGKTRQNSALGTSTSSENLGYSYPKQGHVTDLVIGLDWAAAQAEWLLLTLPVVDPVWGHQSWAQQGESCHSDTPGSLSLSYTSARQTFKSVLFNDFHK